MLTLSKTVPMMVPASKAGSHIYSDKRLLDHWEVIDLPSVPLWFKNYLQDVMMYKWTVVFSRSPPIGGLGEDQVCSELFADGAMLGVLIEQLFGVAIKIKKSKKPAVQLDSLQVSRVSHGLSIV